MSRIASLVDSPLLVFSHQRGAYLTPTSFDATGVGLGAVQNTVRLYFTHKFCFGIGTRAPVRLTQGWQA
jgi:hypothetical protein